MEINGSLPKKIKIIVNKGQDLQLYHPRKIIKRQPRKWRVLFLGVMEKLATSKVESDSGNPEWLCEITVTAKNVQDPISLLVTDSKGRHIGQVLIPLCKVPPPPPDCIPGSRPPLVFSNINKSELEPTNKNSYPKGFLYYWLWAEEYWRTDEIIKMKTKKSLSRSMHDLSNSALNLFRRRKSTTSFQDSEISQGNIRGRLSTDISQRASPVKVNTLKKRYTPGSDSSSSMVSQAFIRPDTMPNSPIMNHLPSMNPFDAMMTEDVSIENNIKQEEPYQPNSNKLKQGIFTKFRFKKSQSSADLSKMIMDKEQTKECHAMPQSLGKQQGHRLLVNQIEQSKSSTDLPSSFLNNVPPSTIHDSSRRMNRLQSCSFHTNNESNLPNHNVPYITDIEYSYKASTFNGNTILYNPTDTPITNSNREAMTKRELIDLIAYLEKQLKVTSDRFRVIERNSAQLHLDKKDVDEELNIVKDDLCRLKLKLLEAGDTKYLEKSEPMTRSEVLSDLALWRTNCKI